VATPQVCARREDGDVLCRGSNASGAVGVPSTTIAREPSPRLLAQGTKGVSAGGNVSCVVYDDGRAACAGSNMRGALGIDDATNGVFPLTAVSNDVNVAWERLFTGGSHTIGIFSTGTLFGWGEYVARQLGVSASSPFRKPIQTGSSTMTSGSRVCSGANATCGSNPAGTGWCGGPGHMGMVGDGRLTSTFSFRTDLSAASGTAWVDVDPGAETTCGGRNDGSLWCWGSGFDGRRGAPSPDPTRPLRVPLH
jgi:alpha-tubulin suppressor-like RCC1 family protein